MVLTVRKPSTARYRQTHARLSHNSWLVCTPHEYFIILDISTSKIDFNKSPEEFPIPYFFGQKEFRSSNRHPTGERMDRTRWIASWNPPCPYVAKLSKMGNPRIDVPEANQRI